MILCLPQELFSSMIVNLCLTLLPKVSICVIEINLTTEFSNSETLKEQNYLRNHKELQARYQNLVSDMPQHLGTIFICHHIQS